jgi:hypothetical protein
MIKHKVVRFINGKARIISTTDLSGYSEDKITTFFNPDLRACKGVSPELWTVFEGQIVPHAPEKQKELREILHIPTQEEKELIIVKKQLRFFKAAAIILAIIVVLQPFILK